MIATRRLLPPCQIVVYKLDKQGNKTSESVEYRIEDVLSEDYQQFDNELNSRMFLDYFSGSKSREEIVSELCGETIYGIKHNSLYDAEVIKAIYEAVV